jgi:SAM-dependent methyltransferase
MVDLRMQRGSAWWFAGIGGGMTTAVELVCTRMLAPFFGTGLQVWASVLAAVLAGFAGGYFLGGVWLARDGQGVGGAAQAAGGKRRVSIAIGILFLAAMFWMLITGLFGEGWMEMAYQWWGADAVIPLSLAIATPPVTFLAAVAPCLVAAGNATGSIYGISTLGGMAGIFLFGYLLLPSVGVFLCWTMIIGTVGALAVTFFWMQRKRSAWWIFGALAGLGITLSATAFTIIRPRTLPDHIILKETGMMGELIVTDLPLEAKYGGGPRRMILNNRIAQTAVNPSAGVSLWDYTHYLATLAGCKPPGSKVLLLGMAGGSVANELVQLGFQVDAVDIDPRVVSVARAYFHLSPEVNVTVDDARHFLNVSTGTYDVIVYDLFAGEGQPSHVFSREAFARARERLTPDGILLINYHGFWNGEEGRGTRSVAATMVSEGFQFFMVGTGGKPVERNIILMGSRKRLPPPGVKVPIHDGGDMTGLTYRQNPCCRYHVVLEILSPTQDPDGIILTDDRPILDHLNQAAYRAWREYAIEHYLLPLQADGLHFY